jgi:hypothetical protein
MRSKFYSRRHAELCGGKSESLSILCTRAVCSVLRVCQKITARFWVSYQRLATKQDVVSLQPLNCLTNATE